MTVVQRQSRTITSDILLTEDADTAPSDIVYDILNGPAFGRLVLADNLTQSAVRFTQADINVGRVVYFHDLPGTSSSSGTPPSVDFYFRVSDGAHKPAFRHFAVRVLPLELRVVNSSAIVVQQGTRTAYIRSRNMGAITNGQRSHTMYNVTRLPRGGQLFVNDAPASLFSQINVDGEEVVYTQTDLSLSNDTFVCMVTNQDAVVTEAVFEVTVAPLISRREPFVAESERRTALSQRHLDASQLSGLTTSNPVYFILRPPEFGRILRVVNASSSASEGKETRSVRDKEVWRFTHEDVKNGVIHFAPDEAILSTARGGGNAVNDSFAFRLDAPGVQPANGIFDFVIVQVRKAR